MRRLEGVSGVALGVLGLVVAVALGIAITAAVRDDGGASPAPANRPATTIVGTTTAPAPTTTAAATTATTAAARPAPAPARGSVAVARERPALERTLWLAAYVIVVLAPLAFVLVAPKDPGRSFGVELAAGLGFGGLTVLGLQLVLPARARPFTRAFGVDLLLRYHRQAGIVALLLVAAHIVVLVVDDPGKLSLLNPVTAPWRAQAAVAATAALVALTATSIWRGAFRLGYESWRGVHIVLGAAVLGFSFAHAVGVHRYTSFGTVWIVALALLGAGGWALAHLRLQRPAAAGRRAYRLRGVREEGGGATTLELEADGHDGDPFRPGQFAWLKLAERPYALDEHPFSYVSSAARPGEPAFTVKHAGDFTGSVAGLEPGTRVLVDGPHGSFRPSHPGGPYLLVAGGIGITPAMSILRTLADEGDAGRHVLVYANRTLDDAVFREELEQLGEPLDLAVVHVLSDPPEDWEGERGRLGEAVLARALDRLPDDPNVFVCGPPKLVDAALAALRALGVRGGSVHAERFAAV